MKYDPQTGTTDIQEDGTGLLAILKRTPQEKQHQMIAEHHHLLRDLKPKERHEVAQLLNLPESALETVADQVSLS